MVNSLLYTTTIKQNGHNWNIYTQVNNKQGNYIDIWIQREDLGIIDFVIGVQYTDEWRDYVTGPIIEFINTTEGDPRYE